MEHIEGGPMDLIQRPRRNRRTEVIRNLTAETDLRSSQLVLPVFLCDGKDQKQAISTMPGIARMSPDVMLKEIGAALKLGIRSFALFPALQDSLKDSHGKESWNPQGLLPTTLRRIKDQYSDVNLITDVALDPYSSDGHDGIVRNGEILNDETVEVLCKMAVVQAQAGADMVAPSDMMDGRVGAMRKALDNNNCHNTGIISYSVKYASSFYGPFREALESAPKFGDKKTYQMDYRNKREALREVDLDIHEGADIVMVKPAMSYLDIIALVKNHVHVPVAAYNVSGEYAMIKAAAKAGMLDETKAMVESLYSMKRAGADIIFTYFAVPMAEWLRDHA